MRRFYAHPRQFDQQAVTLDPEETYHLARVLRLGVGAKVEVCDGQGGNFAVVVTALDPRGAVLQSDGGAGPLGANRPWTSPWGSAWPRERPWTRWCARPRRWE